MPQQPARFRPKAYPPPEFPQRRPARFAKMPPAVFPPILGLIGLVLALRRGLYALDLPLDAADLLAGIALALWAFAAVSYAGKLARRPGVVWEELRTLPGRAGLAAGTAGALGIAALLLPFSALAAQVMLFAGLALHGALALAIIVTLTRLPAEARGVTPVWHLSFVGFIIGGLTAIPLGFYTLSQVLFWGTLPVALAIWGISLVQLLRRVPPAPLRPLLAIHVAPAALLSLVSGMSGQGLTSLVLALLGMGLMLVLLACGRWVIESGFSPLWGGFTFPLAALASALLAQEGVLVWVGVALLALALGFIPWVMWRVLRMWPDGRLAAKTNAAEA